MMVARVGDTGFRNAKGTADKALGQTLAGETFAYRLDRQR